MTLKTQYPYLSSDDWKRIEQRLLEEVIGEDEIDKTVAYAMTDSIMERGARDILRASQRQALHTLIGGEDE